MPNSSATGGSLLPINAIIPLTDVEIYNLIHDWISSVTMISNENIRPRWQPESPNIPDITTDWVAFGITSKETTGQPYVMHNVRIYPDRGYVDTDYWDTSYVDQSPTYGEGYDELRSHRLLRVLVSIYGPNSEYNEMVISRALYISQNQEMLSPYNIALIGHGNSTTIPEFLKEQWIYRVDLPLEFMQQIVLEYSVLNLASAQTIITNDVFTEQIIIN